MIFLILILYDEMLKKLVFGFFVPGGGNLKIPFTNVLTLLSEQ